MCGICGLFYYRDDKKTAEEALLKKMTSLLLHRGPDDEGYFLQANFGMGVRRLSIIDIPGGHQPIRNEDKTIWAVFNGEIYNFIELRNGLFARGHTFYTKSDSEVLVHLYEEYGEDFLHKLNGMFAFALFDTKEKKVFLGRDRIGIKPLYYYEKEGVLVFGSELKAIIAHPHVSKKVNWRSLNEYFSLNYIPGPETVFADIKQLPPGFCLSISNAKTNLRQYWDLRYPGEHLLKEKEAIERLRSLLDDSVKRHLISDVEVGAFLSGGLDSSSLAAIITKGMNRPLKSFCVGFDERLFDESKKAQRLSDYLHTQHYGVVCRSQDLVEFLPQLVRHSDHLLADPAMLPLYLVSKLAKSKVSVVISGDGADEIFAGYPTYVANICRAYYRMIPGFLRRNIIAYLACSLPSSTRKLGLDYKLKKFVEGAEFTREKAHYWWRTIFAEEEKKSIFSREAADLFMGEDAFRAYRHCFERSDFPSFASRCLYSDLKVWLPDNNLARVDTITMAHSLEARVPFLDHEVVEFVASLPFSMKLSHGQTKYILRQAMKKFIPADLLKVKKSPWHVPLASWFKGPLADYVRTTLLDTRVTRKLFNRGGVEVLVKNHLQGRQNNSFKIWGLLVFIKWCEAFEPEGIS